MPASPEPATTSRSSSVKTFVVGDWLNFAVSMGMPRIEICMPMLPSLEPMASSNTACGMSSSISAFTSEVHMTPDETTILSVVVS